MTPGRGGKENREQPPGRARDAAAAAFRCLDTDVSVPIMAQKKKKRPGSARHGGSGTPAVLDDSCSALLRRRRRSLTLTGSMLPQTLRVAAGNHENDGRMESERYQQGEEKKRRHSVKKYRLCFLGQFTHQWSI